MRTMKTTTTKKRRLALFVAVIMALSLWTALPIQASADEISGDYTYTVNGDGETVTITKYTGTDTDNLAISPTLDGKSVTAIAANAFSNNTLTSVTIPATVISINASAFASATALTTITVLAGNPTYSSVDGVLFEQNGTILVRYPAGKTGTYTIPNTVTTIGADAFSRNKTLTTINIPAGVTGVVRNPFTGCTSLTAITVTAGNPNYSSDGGVLFDLNRSTLAAYPAGKSGTSYTIPNSVTIIGQGAFDANTWLQTIDLNNVETIGTWAFASCVTLRAITIPDTVTALGDGTFYACRSLTDIEIPESVKTIGSTVFQECTALTEIAFEGVTNLGNAAFYNCTSLREVTIPGGVENVGDSMFAGCSSLAKVTMEEGVETIDATAFSQCVSLAEVSIPGSMTVIGTTFQSRTALKTVTMAAPAEGTRTIADRAFQTCRSLESISILGNATMGQFVFNGCTSLTDVSIPGLTSVGQYAFIGCTSLETIEIPVTLTSLSTNMFNGCTSLSDITIPANITTIGASTFDGCTALTEITIPSTVTTIGNSAFNACSSLETVVMLIESGTSIDPNAFSNCSSSLTIWCNNPSTAYTYATTQATPRIAVGLLLTGMTIEDSLSLNVGASATLSTPSYLPADEKTETPAVTWTSSDQTKATVDATGKVTAVASGTTDITAEAISLSGEIITSSTCVVTVSPAPSGSITSFTLSDGETVFAGDIASNNTIAVEVPYITNVTALIPAIEVSEGTVEPESGTPADFTNPVVFTTNSTTYTVTVTRAPATKDITSFTLEGVAGTITDTGTAGTIAVTLPAGTNVTALEPVIEHDGASIDISSPQNFTTPVTYTVTGADTLTKAYTVTVTVPLSSAKEITTFTLMDVDGVFDGNIITVTLPYGTSVAGLTPVIDHTSTKSEDPLVLTGSLASNNARYTVTAEDGTTRVYTVIVKFASPSSEADIISLKIGSVVGIINGTDIRVTLPTGTSVTALEPEIEISENATVSPDTGEAQNFTTPVIYTVTAQSGAKQNYTVTVTVTSPPVSTTYVVTVTNGSGSASYEEGATVTITANAPAEGKIFDTWTTSDVTLTDANSSTTTFVMPDHAVAVTATYKDAAEPETYAVTVTNGTGSGNYAEGATVSISANAAPSGKTFDTWTGDVTFANANSASTSFVMPNHAVTVTATYKDATPPTDDNWAYEDGTWYLVDDGGQKLTGWQKVEDTWYYLASSGEMQTGWEHVGSSWYYLAGNGKMQTGWVYIGGKWYYLTTSGAMKTGWQKDKNAWYYLAGNGAMVTAKWLKDTDGSWYYLAGSGKMLTGKQAIGGKAYTFKANGVWVS